MTFGSVCSGIEAASAAWLPLGWQAAWLSEIEAFPSAVLKHHYPDVHNYGDFTTIPATAPGVDVLIGGTPCQSFSIAGLRGGLDDDRGNLALGFCRLLDRKRPRWFVWENVPGVLSSSGGRDFGAILGAMGELGYGTAYRVLDAQYFGVPQRRRRVFVVGHLGDWRRAAAVLFERHCLSGYPAPSREAGQGTSLGFEVGPSGGRQSEVSSTLDARCKDGAIRNQLGMLAMSKQHGVGVCGADDNQAQGGHLIAASVTSKWVKGTGGPSGDECQNLVTHSLRADGFDASEDGTGRGTPLTVVPILEAGARTGVSTTDPRAGSGIGESGDPMYTLQSGKQHAVAFHENQRGELTPNGGRSGIDVGAVAVRRLTPRECERLQGFPDDYTLVPFRGKPAADGPRYKALGNSMAVPVIRWIGERIAAVDAISAERAA
jgi:DNA (cytosine-5)-methyltransferase 1